MKHKDVIDRIDKVLSADVCNVNLYFLFVDKGTNVLKKVVMTKKADAQILSLARNALSELRDKLKKDEDTEFSKLSTANSKSHGAFIFDYEKRTTSLTFNISPKPMTIIQ